MKLRAKLTVRNEAMLAARERFGLTQKALAELACCPLAKVGAMEALDYSGSDARQLAVRIAGVLEIEPEQVMPAGVDGERFETTVSRVADVDLRRLAQAKCLALPSPAMEIDDAEMRSQLRERIAKALKTLSYREREIIKLRYGLGDGYSYTLVEVGHIFKTTRERIRQIEAKAIRKLQQPKQSDELVGYLEDIEP